MEGSNYNLNYKFKTTTSSLEVYRRWWWFVFVGLWHHLNLFFLFLFNHIVVFWFATIIVNASVTPQQLFEVEFFTFDQTGPDKDCYNDHNQHERDDGEGDQCEVLRFPEDYIDWGCVYACIYRFIFDVYVVLFEIGLVTFSFCMDDSWNNTLQIWVVGMASDDWWSNFESAISYDVFTNSHESLVGHQHKLINSVIPKIIHKSIVMVYLQLVVADEHHHISLMAHLHYLEKWRLKFRC
jgi:hypothetical protein